MSRLEFHTPVDSGPSQSFEWHQIESRRCGILLPIFDSGRREPLQNKKDVKKIKRKPLKTEPVQLEEPEVFVLDTNVIIDCGKRIKKVVDNVSQKLKKKKKILICDVITKEAEKKKMDYSQIEKLYGKNRVEYVETTSVRKAAENLESKYELLHSPDSVLLALAIKEKYGIITNDSALADSCDKENVYVYDPRQALTPAHKPFIDLTLSLLFNKRILLLF